MFCGIILEIRTLTLADMWDPGQKTLQTTIEPTLFVDFCTIPLSNQPGTWVEKYFSIVKRAFVLVSLAVWSTRPCWIIGRCVSTSDGPDGPDFVTKAGQCSKSSQWNAFISVSLHSFFDMKNNKWLDIFFRFFTENNTAERHSKVFLIPTRSG